MTDVADVTIVGGGPAGSALAIALGRRGVKVVLYEKKRHPRLKPCGEGLLPHGVTALESLVGLPDVPRVSGLRFSAGDVSVDAPFSSVPGLVVRRDRFDGWLFEHAAATPNVDVRPGTAYRGERGRTLVGADGVRSMFHRRLPGRRPRRKRVGLSTHVTGLDGLGDRVEVYFHDEGELYVAPTGGGEALVSVLLDYQYAGQVDIRALIERTPTLRERMSALRHTTPVLASAPLGLFVPRVVHEDRSQRLLLVGDAAGTPDPISAGGLALALSSTAAAADAVVTGDLEAYQRERLRLGWRAHRLARLMLGLSRNQRRAARVLRHGSFLIPRLVDAAVGPRVSPPVVPAHTLHSQDPR